MGNVFIKDPDAVLDFYVDWGNWLDTDNSEEIDTITWTVPSGLTKDSQSNTTTVAAIWLSGGTDEEDYEVVCHIKTNNSPAREDDRTITIQCRER